MLLLFSPLAPLAGARFAFSSVRSFFLLFFFYFFFFSFFPSKGQRGHGLPHLENINELPERRARTARTYTYVRALACITLGKRGGTKKGKKGRNVILENVSSRHETQVNVAANLCRTCHSISFVWQLSDLISRYEVLSERCDTS